MIEYYYQKQNNKKKYNIILFIVIFIIFILVIIVSLFTIKANVNPIKDNKDKNEFIEIKIPKYILNCSTIELIAKDTNQDASYLLMKNCENAGKAKNYQCGNYKCINNQLICECI
jgi:NADH:ubiquinone oxidoreductase subunit 3 (subunit A)